jgi:hypothetical protein
MQIFRDASLSLRDVTKISKRSAGVGIALITLKGSGEAAAITSQVTAALPPISMRNARLSINGASKCVSLEFAHAHVGLLASILRLAVCYVAANFGFSPI